MTWKVRKIFASGLFASMAFDHMAAGHYGMGAIWLGISMALIFSAMWSM